MRRLVQHVAIAACAGALGMAFINAAGAQQAQAERGKYLVSIAGCNDPLSLLHCVRWMPTITFCSVSTLICTL